MDAGERTVFLVGSYGIAWDLDITNCNSVSICWVAQFIMHIILDPGFQALTQMFALEST